jgi:hypothetical protein
MSGCLMGTDYGGVMKVCGTVVSEGKPVAGPVFFHVKGHGKAGRVFDSQQGIGATDEPAGQTLAPSTGYATLDESGHGCFEFWATYKESYKDPNVLVLDELTVAVGSSIVGGKVISFEAPPRKETAGPILSLEAEFDVDHPQESPGSTEYTVSE